MFFSASTGGFYSREIHGTNMPADVVEITTEQHSALIEGQSNGKVITSDENGFPILIDSVITPEQIQQQNNATARQYLASTDWYVIRMQETGTPIPQDILDAREAARASVVEI